MTIPTCDDPLPKGQRFGRFMTSHELHLANQLAALGLSGRWIFIRGMKMVKDCGDHHAVSIASGTYLPDNGPWVPDLSDESTLLMLVGVVRRVYGDDFISLYWSNLLRCWEVTQRVDSIPRTVRRIGTGRFPAEAILEALKCAPVKEAV